MKMNSACMAYAWSCMGYAWNIFGICKEIYGICMDNACNLCRISMEYARKSMEICGICMEILVTSMEYAWKSGEYQRDRIKELAIAELNSQTNLDLERIKSDYKSITGVGGLIGDILSSDMTKTLGSSIIGKAFNLIQENKNVQYFTYRI